MLRVSEPDIEPGVMFGTFGTDSSVVESGHGAPPNSVRNVTLTALTCVAAHRVVPLEYVTVTVPIVSKFSSSALSIAAVMATERGPVVLCGGKCERRC